MKKSLFLLCILFLFSTQIEATSHALANTIQKFSNRADELYHLSFTVSLELGGEPITKISLFYSSKTPGDIEDIRPMIVDLADLLLSDINHNPVLSSELSPFPYTIDQIGITIFFRDKKGNYASKPYVGQVALVEGLITYYSFNGESFEVMQEEPFTKAAKGSSN